MPALQADGTYRMRVVDFWPALIGEKKTPAIKIKGEIIAGEHLGEHASGTLFCSDAAIKNSMAALVVLGMTENDFDTLPNIAGAEFDGVCQWNASREYVNIEYFNAGGGVRYGEISLDDFKAKVLGKAPEAATPRPAAKRGKKAPPVEPVEPDEPPVEDEDDLPF